MRFSIIVPAYNVQDYLQACIGSIAEQGCTDYEVVLVEDGATDGTPALCDALAERYDRIEVIHQQNRGLSGARNTGIRHARGDYLLFVDSDDLIAPDSLEKLSAFIDGGPFDTVVMRRMTCMPDGTMKECGYCFDRDVLGRMDAAEQYRYLQRLPDCWLGAWLFCVRRTFLLERELFFYEGILHEDEEWVPRLFFNAGVRGYLNAPVYCNRIDREGSITATPNIKRLFDRLLIARLLLEEFQKEKYGEKVRRTVRLRTQGLVFGVLLSSVEYRHDPRYAALMQEMSGWYGLLRDSERKLYVCAWWMVKLLGAEAAAGILKRCESLKR